MDLENVLMRELSRRQMDYAAHCIGGDASAFERLMRIVLHGREPVVQRAAWAMDICLAKHPCLLSPWVDALIDALPRMCNNGVKRQAVKALASCSFIPEQHEGQLAGLCFDWLQSADIPVAIKVHCMQILANIAARHPGLAGELRTVIVEQTPRNSAGFASRAKKILKRLPAYSPV